MKPIAWTSPIPLGQDSRSPTKRRSRIRQNLRRNSDEFRYKNLKRAIAITLAIAGAFVGCQPDLSSTYTVEVVDYQRPTFSNELSFVDDVLADKNPIFDPTLIDSRTIRGWSLNSSAAVIQLDSPLLRPDQETDIDLFSLLPSYAIAMQRAKRLGTFLPSANLIDGAAKPFDDGLCAALELAIFRGEVPGIPAAPMLVRTVFDKLAQDSAARPFLAVALELNGDSVPLSSVEREFADKFLREFQADQIRSKPIGFYTWTDELQRLWRFYRFLQQEFAERESRIPRAIAQVLQDDQGLRQQYETLIGFFGRLTNPPDSLDLTALMGNSIALDQLANEKGVANAAVSIFPSATSRENELFQRLFDLGVPQGTDLFITLIREIQNGKIDLQPGPNDGWYQYQVFALETLILPTRGEESPKLMLTADYKRRLVEAFKALMTKRRETHSRLLEAAKNSAEAMPEVLRPRLRVEPCVTFYLRTARAYAFLENVLVASVGEQQLQQLHRLGEGGASTLPLLEELRQIRERFYGLYLVSCDDIGLRPAFLADEPVDPPTAMAAALRWLDRLDSDPDLMNDTRVSIPIFDDRVHSETRLWATIGVRLARLDAKYARPPMLRSVDNPDGAWEKADDLELPSQEYLIPIDEHLEVILPGSVSLTREELRKICDQYQTRDAMQKALRTRSQ